MGTITMKIRRKGIFLKVYDGQRARACVWLLTARQRNSDAESNRENI
jgi:hypothetical protein